MKTFYTQYNRPAKTYEYNSGEVLVERHSFVSVRDQFRALLQAGKRADLARGYDSDIQPDIENLQYDPTRRRNYDLADYSADVAEVRRRLKEAKDERIRKEKEAMENANNAGQNSGSDTGIDSGGD